MGDKVMSTDGQLYFSISGPTISFVRENWKPTRAIVLACRLRVDDSHEIQSKYRTVLPEPDIPAEYYWESVSDEFITALEKGKTLEVTLIDKDEEDIYVKEYSLEGFAENLIALRKLQKDSPRVEMED